MLSPSSS
ncbi:hypothetical protein F383_24588 [Gossypium arboreum]|nr:hypothetical protein F383_24588 [Gossypium arboreum]